MKSLRPHQPLVELRLEPVQQLPGKIGIRLQVLVPSAEKTALLLPVEDAQIRLGVPVKEVGAPPRDGHVTARSSIQPSSSRFPRRGREASLWAARDAGVPRTPRQDFLRWGCARRATARRCSGCNGRPAG